MVLVVTHQISERIHYVLHEIFTANHNIELEILTSEDFLNLSLNEDIFKKVKGVFLYLNSEEGHSVTFETLKIKANSCFENVPVISIYGEALLWENRLNQRWSNPEMCWIETPFLFNNGNTTQSALPVLFPNKNSDTQFDPFAAVFWILCRYEENLWFQSIESELNSQSIDLSHRFSQKNSHAFLNQYEVIPAVDWTRIYLIRLAGYTLNEEQSLRKRSFRILPTADIDIHYKFGKRGWLRNLGSWLRSAVYPKLMIERFRAWVTGTDPFDISYRTLSFLSKHPHSRLFLLHSNKQDLFHKQNQLKHPDVRKAIDRLFETMDIAQIGIHPSISAITNQQQANEWLAEKSNLESGYGGTVQSSRFHYLYFHLPLHYQQIVALGVHEEWSMGYHDGIGFRAGTSFPFRWFDLSLNKTQKLSIFPFQIMDVTCKNYLNLNPDISIDKSNSIKQSIEFIGGDFTFVFHNESISESYPWNGWSKTIYEWAKPNTQKPNG